MSILRNISNFSIKYKNFPISVLPKLLKMLHQITVHLSLNFKYSEKLTLRGEPIFLNPSPRTVAPSPQLRNASCTPMENPVYHWRTLSMHNEDGQTSPRAFRTTVQRSEASQWQLGWTFYSERQYIRTKQTDKIISFLHDLWAVLLWFCLIFKFKLQSWW